MTRKQKVVTICVFLGAVAIFIFIPKGSDKPEGSLLLKSEEQISQSANQVPSENQKLDESEEVHPILAYCEGLKSFSKEDIKVQEAFAENTHFRKEGEVYRIRVFVEEGQNTSFKKLVLLKEDDDGFPKIVKGSQINNPTKEQIEEILSGGEVIHHEADISLELKDGRFFNYSEVNGQVTKVLDGNSGYPCSN